MNVNPDAPLKDPNTYTVIGQPVARLDLAFKLRDTGRNGQEWRPPPRSGGLVAP